jgi:hypothetical protein
VAYPEDAPASGFAPTADDSVFNLTIDRLFVGGFIEITKEVRLLDANGNLLQNYTDNPTWNAQPGQILEYKITYRNLASRTTGGSGSITLTANNLVITEDGTTADTDGTTANIAATGNNWALDNDNNDGDDNSLTSVDTVHVNGGALATLGSITYDASTADPVTGTNVQEYENNVGTLSPQQTGTFTFRRRIE